MSLKWRIAAWYTALLIAVMAISGGIVIWRLQAILTQEARTRIDATMSEIAQAASPQAVPFGFEDASASLAVLLDSNNLANWESPSSFVQVDSVKGYPLAKSSNLGGKTIPANRTLTAAHARAFRMIALGSRQFLVEDRLLRNGSDSAIVHVAQPLNELNRTFVQTRTAIAIVFGAAILAVFGLSILLASQAIDPIDKLSRAMREIGSDRLDRRFARRHRNDEIGRLAESFDDLLERLGGAFARERQFISDASHELKTPLTSINANAQMLLRWGDRDESVRRESLQTIVDESATLAAMVTGMLTLAKADRGDDIPKEQLALARVASDAVSAAAQRAADKGLTLSFEALTPSPTILADERLLRQLIGNLIDNAMKFTEEGGVNVRVAGDETRGWVEVADTGSGIPEQEGAHVFERFYRADRARSRSVPGTGLGLAIVRSIARVHDASVEVGRAPEGGALFRVTFPAVAAVLTDPS
ncbi:MAG TPA: HAMP domain-containing sensor histidine kinase [Candidatus Baltobacteraceae bacterium]|nr:HAMP domain-containing sensor histidine kinase [Candidatus Baltobacteraceae bacterium]